MTILVIAACRAPANAETGGNGVVDFSGDHKAEIHGALAGASNATTGGLGCPQSDTNSGCNGTLSPSFDKTPSASAGNIACTSGTFVVDVLTHAHGRTGDRSFLFGPLMEGMVKIAGTTPAVVAVSHRGATGPR